ncbi:MAG TPA: ribosome assembly RNA-binding protein YhbY [Epulopiscium sp.]|nr:ribosome assembly RNA-binding protein YhbY [Candidatus Epulonipiscium sp.]
MNKLTSKQRAHLRGLAQTIDPIFQIGKSGITPELTKTIDEALEARELIKLSVLSNCMVEPEEASDTISGRTKSIPVQVIGRKITLYRASKTKPKIQLPK